MSEAVPDRSTWNVAETAIRRVFPDARVTEVITRTGGQLSTVLEVRCAVPVDPVIVKIYAEQWRWKRDKEAHVYRLLAEHRVSPREG
jgi:hygromycin-B 7''-O-kinase